MLHGAHAGIYHHHPSPSVSPFTITTALPPPPRCRRHHHDQQQQHHQHHQHHHCHHLCHRHHLHHCRRHCHPSHGHAAVRLFHCRTTKLNINAEIGEWPTMGQSDLGTIALHDGEVWRSRFNFQPMFSLRARWKADWHGWDWSSPLQASSSGEEAWNFGTFWHRYFGLIFIGLFWTPSYWTMPCTTFAWPKLIL